MVRVLAALDCNRQTDIWTENWDRWVSRSLEQSQETLNILLTVKRHENTGNVTAGVLHRYRSSSPMYWMAVALYFLQSSQNWLAENLLRRARVAPIKKSTGQHQGRSTEKSLRLENLKRNETEHVWSASYTECKASRRPLFTDVGLRSGERIHGKSS